MFSISYLIATPNQSNWGRFIYIGNFEHFYFCYFIYRYYPGSYYDYTDSIFICKFSKNSCSLEEKYLLSVTVHKDTSSYGHWIHLTNTTNFSVEEYLRDNHVWYDFPSKDLEEFTPFFEKGNLFLKKLTKGLIISKEEKNLVCLRMVLDNTRGYNIEMLNESQYFFDETARVVEYYKDDQYNFFIISIGHGCCINSNYFQYIIPIPISDITKVVEELEKE